MQNQILEGLDPRVSMQSKLPVLSRSDRVDLKISILILVFIKIIVVFFVTPTYQIQFPIVKINVDNGGRTVAKQ